MNKQKTICGNTKPEDLPKGRTAKQCLNCSQWFHLPNCHAEKHKCCSSICNKDLRDKVKKQRERKCKLCGNVFVPRTTQIKSGGGIYCSIKCLGKVLHTYKTPEMEEKRIQALREKIASGQWTHHKGKDNPLWKGGPKAARQRQVQSGKDAERVRKYRKANPHKVREWSQKRSNGYLQKLPYGTIPKLLKLQNKKCAYCETCVKSSYHVDHIVPIAKGGKHVPDNLQILCPPCNLRKSSIMPHEFAQKIGKLI